MLSMAHLQVPSAYLSKRSQPFQNEMFKLMKETDPNNIHIICCLGLLKAEQTQVFLGEILQPSDHLCDPPLDPLQKDLVYLIKKTQTKPEELSFINKNIQFEPIF